MRNHGHMKWHDDDVQFSLPFFLSVLAVANTCFSLDCILITSMNSFHGTICHSPQLFAVEGSSQPIFLYMKTGLVFPHLHNCLHQISSVILLPTQSSRLLLQVCIIIFAVQNTLLTSYSQQMTLLTLLPCLHDSVEKHKCQ